MNETADSIGLQCARLLFQPVVRFCLRRGISVQQMVESVKRAVVQIGVEEITARGEKVNTSRLSAMSGLHRRDVDRILTERPIPELPASLAARICAQWESDRRFSSNGRPRRLSLSGGPHDFSKLLATVGSDLNLGTVVFELARRGVAERVGDQLVLKRRHISTRGDTVESFQTLAEDAGDLIATVEGNTLGEPVQLHARTEFDNIPLSEAENVRTWILEEGGRFHARVRRFLAKLDLDVQPRSDSGGVRVAVGSFSRIEIPALPARVKNNRSTEATS